MSLARFLTLVMFVGLVASFAPGALAAEPLPAELTGVTIEQRLDAQVPLDLVFRDELGREVSLRALIDGKPTILNFVYYDCPMLCTLVVNGLVSSLRAVSFDAGSEFRVLTLSIDPREGPALASAKKANVLEEYGRAGSDGGWRFLTGDEASIRRLSDTVGFSYRWDPVSKTFAHASGIMVLTPAGRVSRYFFGVEYAPRDVKLALLEASQSKIGSLADRLMLFCYRYDPATSKYGLAALRLVRTGGVLTVVALAAFIYLARRRETRQARRVPIG